MDLPTSVSACLILIMLCPHSGIFWLRSWVYFANRCFWLWHWCSFVTTWCVRKWEIIPYASKVIFPRKQKYSTTEKEAFAVVFGTAHFSIYLLGHHFQLITDHSALCWLHTIGLTGVWFFHEALGISQYEVVFGQLSRLPVELELGMPLTNPSTQSEYLVSVRLVVSKGEKEMVVHYNQLKHSYIPFQEGEPVCPSRGVKGGWCYTSTRRYW